MDDSIPEERKAVMSVAPVLAPSVQESALDRIAALVSELPLGHQLLLFLSGSNGESGGVPSALLVKRRGALSCRFIRPGMERHAPHKRWMRRMPQWREEHCSPTDTDDF